MSNRSEGDGHDVREWVDAAVLRSWGLPQPGRTKQSRGDAVIGGASRRTPGAVILAFEAAMRVGVGRVAVLVPGSVEEQLGEHLTEAAAAGATAQDASSVGHVHLSVGDVATARAFYVGALGFDETAALGNQAAFVSAGSYHHHMAMNVWNSRGAGPRMPALGLGRVDLPLPDADALGALGERRSDHGFTVRDDASAGGRTLAWIVSD